MPPPNDFDNEELLLRLTRGLRRTAERTTPDFLRKMPDPYFRDTDEATLLVHLSAVVAARAAGMAPRMILKDPKQQTWTFVQEQSYRGLLSDLVEQLPRDQVLSSAKVHTATDGGLAIDVFRFGEAPRLDPDRPEQAAKLGAIVAYARGLGDTPAVEELPAYVAQCSADFVMAASPLRVYETWCLARTVEKTDEVACAVAPQSDPQLARISVVAGNADTRTLFERYVRHFGRLGLDITRAYLDVIRSDGRHAVSLLSFVVRDPDRALDLDGAPWAALRLALKRLRWVDDQVIERLDAQPGLGLLRAESLVALTRLVHPLLARDNPFSYTRNRLFQHLDRGPELAATVADLLLDRFSEDDPPSRERLLERERAIVSRIDAEVDDQTARRYWTTLLRAIASVKQTNINLEDRYGLALMIDPGLFAHRDREAEPHGIIFVHASRVDGFHVRFEELARGSVRAVHPRGAEQYVIASERLFEEVYDRAFAQQLKNKDIPEGGAAAIVLVEPEATVEEGVKPFMDGILDLMIPGDGRRSERIYLSPDENISASLVDWVVERVQDRGYPQPAAFMGAKSGSALDRRVFEVTSEGLTVFVEEALKAVGIDPRRTGFTVKLIGGPNGDLASHLIRILHREFGALARIVGIADGSGAAWDPAGLDHRELLRLVDRDSSIARFDRSLVGPHGAVAAIEEPDGLRRRNRLHFDVQADAFVAVGGRAQTINGENWREFLKDERPTSRVVVEGIDNFITPEARRHLSAAGVLIIQDSSANKCGVVCSSYEVAASLLLSTEALSERRERFDREVLEKLQALARSEAVRVLADCAEDPTASVPDRADAVSRAILRATHALAARLPALTASTRAALASVVAQHLPTYLLEAAGPGLERLPAAYRDRIVAARLAARIVYREGTDFVDRVPPERLAQRCLDYFRMEEEAEALAAEVVQSALPGAARIADLLRAGGARSALLMTEPSDGEDD